MHLNSYRLNTSIVLTTLDSLSICCMSRMSPKAWPRISNLAHIAYVWWQSNFVYQCLDQSSISLKYISMFRHLEIHCWMWLYLKRLYFISSAIAYCISPYASFYAGLSCCNYQYTITALLRNTFSACIFKFNPQKLHSIGNCSIVAGLETSF